MTELAESRICLAIRIKSRQDICAETMCKREFLVLLCHLADEEYFRHGDLLRVSFVLLCCMRRFAIRTMTMSSLAASAWRTDSFVVMSA